MEHRPEATSCVCASLRMATRVVAKHYDRALAPAGISTNAYSILVRLRRLGPLPLGALAASLAIDRSTLSRELAPLAAMGLVETTTDPDDRRKRVLSLTEAGRARVEAARPLWAEAQRRLEEEFGRTRATALVGELNALAGAAP